MMKNLALFIFFFGCACVPLTSCGGSGSSDARTEYSLSVSDFMRGRKCILISGRNCAFAIVPERFTSNEITSPEVLCDGRIYVYKNAETSNILSTYRVSNMKYEVDELGVGYLTCPGVMTSSIDDNWMRFCGVLAGTGGEYGAGQDGNYATISNLNFILNFSGPDIGIWEESCHVLMGQLSTDLQANGTLLLRPKEKLGL